MKNRITSFQLLLIILIQIILIDVVLIAYFVKQADSRPIGNIVASATDNGKKVEAVTDNKKVTDTKKVTGTKKVAVSKPVITMQNSLPSITPSKTNAPMNTPGKNNNIASNSIDFPFKNLKRLKKPPGRDFKIMDEPFANKSFIATTYDLSYQSCGKYPSHPAYGITFSGTKAIKGRTIAVDPNVIPLGSNVYIEFPEPYFYLNGWYTAEDTGSKVKGNIIDIFLGESAFSEMEKFGSRKVNVRIKAN